MFAKRRLTFEGSKRDETGCMKLMILSNVDLQS